MAEMGPSLRTSYDSMVLTMDTGVGLLIDNSLDEGYDTGVDLPIDGDKWKADKTELTIKEMFPQNR